LQAEASFQTRTEVPASYAVLARVSPGYPPLPGRLPTCYSPVRRSPVAEATFAHDLHVLSTPPAFILSQDQTLQFRPLRHADRLRLHSLFLFGIAPAHSVTHGGGQRKHRAWPLTLLPLSSFQRTDAPFSEANSDLTDSASGCQALIAATRSTTGRAHREFPGRGFCFSVKEPVRLYCPDSQPTPDGAGEELGVWGTPLPLSTPFSTLVRGAVFQGGRRGGAAPAAPRRTGAPLPPRALAVIRQGL
jgi:hypothetical protein